MPDWNGLPVRDHFTDDMGHMSDWVTQNHRAANPGEEGCRDLTIIAATYQAAQDGQDR